MPSLWEQTSEMPHFGALDDSISTDVLIIGGGIAGILCAYMLRASGIDCVLLEAKTLCSGITKNTTAKITSQHGLIYDRLIRQSGFDAAAQYLRANEAALDKYRTLCANIDCGFEETESFVYSRTDRQKLIREYKALSALDFPAYFTDTLPLPFPVAGAVCFPKQAQFHPLQFLSGIARDLPVYEHSTVRELIGLTALTDRGRVRAKNIIVTTHFPFLNKHGGYYIKLYQSRSYVLALKNAQNVGGMYVDEAEKGLSFRNFGELLLLGGGDHRTGRMGGGWNELREFAARYYPESKDVCRWATQDCVPLDGVPYIGRYAAGTENLYVATGFNKWGMTSSMTAAMLLTDLLQGRDNPASALFSPTRSILRPRLAANAFEAAVSLLTPGAKRCPHLGCALKWNPVEHSWDCPCHGSRFTPDGRLIDNPSTGDLNK